MANGKHGNSVPPVSGLSSGDTADPGYMSQASATEMETGSGTTPLTSTATHGILSTMNLHDAATGTVKRHFIRKVTE